LPWRFSPLVERRTSALSGIERLFSLDDNVNIASGGPLAIGKRNH
jgi:hypothetical protein